MSTAAINKDIKTKENFAGNHFHNFLRLSDVLPNFPFTKKEIMGVYYV